jgi:hypothetical protein
MVMKKLFNEIMITLAVMCMALVPVVAVAKISFAQQSGSGANIGGNLCGGANLEGGASTNCEGDDASDKVTGMVTWVINIISWIVGIVSVVMIIWGGFQYITSGGNDTKVTSAKNTILYAIIGLVIVALAQIIVKFVIGKITSQIGNS